MEIHVLLSNVSNACVRMLSERNKCINLLFFKNTIETISFGISAVLELQTCLINNYFWWPGIVDAIAESLVTVAGAFAIRRVASEWISVREMFR